MKSTSIESMVGKTHEAVLLFDIDGTLVADSESMVTDSSILQALQILKEANSCFIVSNGPDPKRNQAIASQVGFPLLHSKNKKPMPQAISHLPPQLRDNVKVVVGDKWLTDGLFALFTHAQFHLAPRILSGQESLKIKCINLIDNGAAPFIFILLKLCKRL